MFIHGLASVTPAIRRTVRGTVIEDYFAKCQIYLYSCNAVLIKCTADISVEESLRILGAISDLARILLTK